MESTRSRLPAEILDRIREIYNIGDWHAWERTPKGGANVSFFVTASSGRYVLRCSAPQKSVESMALEVDVITYLQQCGYPAPALIPTRWGERYAEHAGTFYLLTALIPGAPYDPNMACQLAAAGRGLGLYHRHMRAFPSSRSARATTLTLLSPESRSRLAAVRALAARSLGAEERACLSEACAYLEDQFHEINRALIGATTALSQLVVHGSYGKTALVFGGDALTGVLDYDRAAWGHREMDLAYSLKAFCRPPDERHEDYWVGLDLARCGTFLAGYRDAEPLTRDTVGQLPLLFRTQRLQKILNKCKNFLAKDAVVPQEANDVRKITKIIEHETVRLRWLERRSAELRAALLN
jgi:Ser/Thr protein kinase RdoA (MazF antagonist)